ncbi:hypothetical protein [Parabacteroides sp. PF5-9]|uniref:hypothetical protein n=1 Tax=Parabacteroides sp. PF5-9 TaxID=1742404 RepID=UPI002473E788|nr:hypothetical protein [Parabacteroides sp. PF5-9]MDH6357794.1 hypothetical protein [Parabacteroides sp. PF5-9]
METLEELQMHRQAALIVVCTLGLAAVPIAFNWKSNLFAGTSLDNGGLGFVLKIISFLLLTIACAIPAFVIYLIKLIYCQIQISRLTH